MQISKINEKPCKCNGAFFSYQQNRTFNASHSMINLKKKASEGTDEDRRPKLKSTCAVMKVDKRKSFMRWDSNLNSC